MRVENWKLTGVPVDAELECAKRLQKAGDAVADIVRSKCPVGTITRPMYSRGPNRDKPWTARDAGQLKRSVRVVGRYEKSQESLMNARVYAGHYLAYYASIVEKTVRPFMKQSKTASRGIVKALTGAK